MNFSSLGLSAPILDAIKECGYENPSPIQLQAIPVVLSGRDLMAAAQTGTGKTAGFTLPILEMLTKTQKAEANQTKCLILTPTRELAAQIYDNIISYSKNLNLTSTVVFGGVKINPQMMRLRKGSDLLVATPGRLLDLYNQNAIKFKQLEFLVLDEADRMLDMGFIHDIKKIIALLPKKRQNLLFSATFSEAIRNLAKTIVHDPIEVSVTPRNTATELVTQWVHILDKTQKSAALCSMIAHNNWEQVLVFSKTKHGANRLVKYLNNQGLDAGAIHGNKSQGARTKVLDDFKNSRIRVLVATDIAARGLDIEQLPHVINFDLPSVPEDYIHRIGRTGRAGSLGEAISLVCADDAQLLFDIEKLLQKEIERKELEGFKIATDVPKSGPNARAPKPKQNPRTPRQNNQAKSNSKSNNTKSSHAKSNSNNSKSTQARGNSKSQSGQNSQSNINQSGLNKINSNFLN